jgi:DMSO reductase family type II enzyme heme b subunit
MPAKEQVKEQVMRSSFRLRTLITIGGIAFLAAGFLSCGKGGPPRSPGEVLAVRRAALPVDPAAPEWKKAPLHTAALLLQDIVEPRLLTASTKSVDVQAITDGTRIAFRIAWLDSSANDLPGASRFSDGCAVQLPAVLAADMPAPQMGESGRAVEIAYWRAAWQAVVDGRPDSIQALYPGAAVDHYPFQAPTLAAGSPEQAAMAARYAPARALGNTMGGPRVRAVEDLIAEGPGTLYPAPETRSDGRGARTKTGWSVVISRPLPAALQAAGRTQAAFAVWEGGREEVGARKMRTGWVPLAIEGAPAKKAEH